MDNKPVQLGPKGTARTPKEPLKCWECEGTHIQRYSPLLSESTILYTTYKKLPLWEKLARVSTGSMQLLKIDWKIINLQSLRLKVIFLSKISLY